MQLCVTLKELSTTSIGKVIVYVFVVIAYWTTVTC